MTRHFTLECSHVDSPDAFWSLYVDRVAPEGAEQFGRNLDAFWDALARRGPGWPGQCTLEVRNIEQLARRGHEKFVDRLEKVVGKLAATQSEVKVQVVHLGAKGPRGRLYEHTEFVSHELAGQEIVGAWAHRPRPEGELCEALWLELAGGLWHKFWLSDGRVVWDECGAKDRDAFVRAHGALEPLDSFRLVGHRLEQIEATPTDEGPAWVRIYLDRDRYVQLFPLDPAQPDSPTTLQVGWVLRLQLTYT